MSKKITKKEKKGARPKKNIFVERRFGKFSIGVGYLFRDPKAAANFLKEIIITRAEMVISSDSIEYEGCSRHFKPLQMKQAVPFYQFNIVIETGDIVDVKEMEFYGGLKRKKKGSLAVKASRPEGDTSS